MFARKGSSFIFSALFIIAMGACGNFGGCGACSASQPLPDPGNAPQVHGMPADQTVEGGAQMRVTPQGFQKLANILPGMLNDGLSGGFCVPQGSVGSCGGFPDTGACYCVNDNTSCGQNNCKANVTVNSLTVSVPSQDRLRIDVSTTLSTQIQIKGSLLGVNLGTCTLDITSPSLGGSLDIALGVKSSDGELDIHLAQINQFNLNLDISGCGFLGQIANLVADLLDGIINSFIGNFVLDLLTPTIDNLLQSLIPSPLGIAGMMDVGGMLESVSPGTNALMEARIVPGGYAQARNGGLSLGVITGLNADQDPLTRNVGLTSEPNLCVPPFTPPNFGAPPANLPITSRQTFGLAVANEFDGGADNVPITGTTKPDVMIGVSETTLDLAGHHAVSSGMMCLGVGTNFIDQLNVGTIGILVPSVAELQSENGNDPLLLVTRPQRPLDFTIGDNTATSPALTIGISHLEVDFYAFLFERYVRAFTLDLTMNVGINLDFEQPPTGPAQIKPTLVGISSDQVTITVLNSQFVRETPADLEAVLPSVFDLVTPLLGDIPPIDVPTFAGFTLENLGISKITTSQDDFLALKATFGANAALAAFNAKFNPGTLSQPSDGGFQSAAKARLASVSTPAPALVRAALKQQTGGAMPKVVFDVDKVDPQGRQLEWSYSIGGMYRPFQTPQAGGLVIEDRAFAWQGKYDIALKSRVVGDYKTTSEAIKTPVIIDSVGPRFVTQKAEWDGDVYNIQIWDIVSGNIVQWALGAPGATVPASEWHDGGFAAIDKALLTEHEIDGEVELFAHDEAGNVSHVRLAPFHGSPGDASGCNCDAGSRGLSIGTLLLFGMVGIVIMRGRRIARRIRRHRRKVKAFALWIGVSLLTALVPSCSCGNESACELFSDCPECGVGEIAFCIDGECVCSDDIVMGRLGPYSDVAKGSDGTIWVSAYHAQYGDLVVAKVDPALGRIPDTAWEWVDGVPDGPVIVPQSLYRHGIAEKGEDVGMYTSIQVAPDGTPEVTYFDRDTGSLRFAARNADGTWSHHVIEQGTGELGESGALIGMYTSMVLRGDNGNPGVAYLAHVSDTQGGPRAEVRFASAQSAHPTSAGEWMIFTVDSAPLVSDPNNPNIYPLPEGLGLFVDLARGPQQEPVVVYYDRANGELKVSKFDIAAGNFAAPTVLDGTGDVDAGWSPSVAVDAQGVVHVAYVDATNDDLVYTTDAAGATREIVDDGRRIVGTTVDGLPKPEYHFVGDDASLVLNGSEPLIAYQDATTQELLLTAHGADGLWHRVSVAGATDPWPGGYGFFAADVLDGTEVIMSTWVVDQPNDDNWVEVFKHQVAVE